MLDVLQGFGIVGIVIGLGFLLAHARVLDLDAQRILTRVSFWIATPALLLGLVAEADLRRVFGVDFAVHAIAVAVVIALALVLWRFVFRADGAATTMAAISSSYSNSVNLGLPIAVYALDDATAIVPLVVLQLAFLQPVVLAALDLTSGTGRFTATSLLRPFRNPLIIATALGVVLSVTGWELPEVLAEPVGLVGSMAVPAILMAFGISLRLGPRFGAGGSWPQVVTASLLKLVVMPAVAVLVGSLCFGASGHELLAVAVIAALPTAQNVFGFAAVYRTRENFSRDTIFLTTVLAVPAVLGITAVLG